MRRDDLGGAVGGGGMAGSSGGSGYEYIADSLCRTAEINTTL